MFIISAITSQNPIRYNIDKLSTRIEGVLRSSSSAVNLSRASRVTGIIVSGAQPSGTSRYFAFQTDGRWGKLTPSGTFQAFSVNGADFSNLEANGNTAAELNALGNIPALAGRIFGFAAALSTEDPANALPTCALAFKCETDSQVLTTSEYSPLYELGDESQIIRLESDTQASDGGAVSVSARITKQDGTYSDWAALDSFSGSKARAVQFRGDYTARTVGVSSAHVNKASVLYSDGSSITSGISKGEIISVTQDWYMPVKSCRLTIKHAPLENSAIDAFIAFRDAPVSVKGENLGVGTGGRKTFQLSHTQGLKYDTLRLYYDNVRVYTEYEFNCQAGRVTCAAPEGVIVSCDYEHGWDLEQWEQMELSSRMEYDGYAQSEYRYTTEFQNKSVCALKIVLGVTSGHIVNERLGYATGSRQSFRLSKRIDDGKITVTADNAVLSGKNWSLSEDPQYISVSAGAGKYIRATYDWVSEPPKVYQYAAVYSE